MKFTNSLPKNGFTFFKLDSLTGQEANYGDGISVKAKELEQYFLPYTAHVLFPLSLKENGFHRFTKLCADEIFHLTIRSKQTPFRVQSIDMTVGPFGLAFLTVRVTLDSANMNLSDVLDFAHHFRTVEAKLDEEQGAFIIHPDEEHPLSVHDFLFKRFCPFLDDFILHDENLDRYFGSLPYFEDERMLVAAFLFSHPDATITDDQLYRMGAVDGRDSEGKPFISANSPRYIRRFLEQSLHDRWAPSTYTVVTEHAYMTITTEPTKNMERSLSQFMGTHYYNFFLHYFYKIMLLRVAYEYSKIDWDKDEEYVKSLIKLITMFSSLYYNQEVSTRSEGKELSNMFRNAFHLDVHFDEVNNTLRELYNSQENQASDRMNMLLFILTVFTVISGIYGMNLVIKDWESPAGWKGFMDYTFFEWISFITAVSGIALSCYLVFTTLNKLLKSKWRRRKSKNHMY